MNMKVHERAVPNNWQAKFSALYDKLVVETSTSSRKSDEAAAEAGDDDVDSDDDVVMCCSDEKANPDLLIIENINEEVVPDMSTLFDSDIPALRNILIKGEPR